MHTTSISYGYLDSGALDTGCKVIPEEKSPVIGGGGTSQKRGDKAQIVFNFETEVKEQHQGVDEHKYKNKKINFNFQAIKIDAPENQLDSIEVKDPIVEVPKPSNQLIMIKENGQDQDICPTVVSLVAEQIQVEEMKAPAKRIKKGGFNFKIDIVDSNIKD